MLFLAILIIVPKKKERRIDFTLFQMEAERLVYDWADLIWIGYS